MTTIALRTSRDTVFVPADYVTTIESDIASHGDYATYLSAMSHRRAGRVAPVLGSDCLWSRDVWDAVLRRRAGEED